MAYREIRAVNSRLYNRPSDNCKLHLIKDGAKATLCDKNDREYCSNPLPHIRVAMAVTDNGGDWCATCQRRYKKIVGVEW